MSKGFLPAVAGAVFAVLAVLLVAPAFADDDIATKARVCAACHGENGVPTDPKTMPIIGGQQSNYLFKELQNYHSGERKSPVMQPVVHDFSFDDLRALANYFAAKPWPAGHPANPPGTIPEKAVMCRACHGQNFEGGAPAPRLAGLSAEYLNVAMASFAHDQRTNNGDMPRFMKELSDGERDAIAHYLAGL
jgi:cytochrome c553